jgi:hypothetical protein
MEELKGLGRAVPEAEAVDSGWDAYAVWKERVLLPRQGRLRLTGVATASETEVPWRSLALVPRSGS